MKPVTKRALDIFFGRTAHQYVALQQMIFQARQYLDTQRRLSDIRELVAILDNASSDDDSDARGELEMWLGYYARREWSMFIDDDVVYHQSDLAAHSCEIIGTECGITESVRVLPYIEADGRITTVEASQWYIYTDWNGMDWYHNRTHDEGSAGVCAPNAELLYGVYNSNNTMCIYAVLSRPARVLQLTRDEDDLYYGGDHVIVDPAIETQAQLFAALRRGPTWSDYCSKARQARA